LPYQDQRHNQRACAGIAGGKRRKNPDNDPSPRTKVRGRAKGKRFLLRREKKKKISKEDGGGVGD